MGRSLPRVMREHLTPHRVLVTVHRRLWDRGRAELPKHKKGPRKGENAAPSSLAPGGGRMRVPSRSKGVKPGAALREMAAPPDAAIVHDGAPR